MSIINNSFNIRLSSDHKNYKFLLTIKSMINYLKLLSLIWICFGLDGMLHRSNPNK